MPVIGGFHCQYNSPMQARPTLAIIGGTGALGSGLAMRWAAAGYPVVLGSRSRDKAEAAARGVSVIGLRHG